LACHPEFKALSKLSYPKFFIRKSHQHAGIKRLSFFVVAGLTAMYVYKKVLVNLTDFHASLWTGRGQNTVCPWQLYENEVSK